MAIDTYTRNTGPNPVLHYLENCTSTKVLCTSHYIGCFKDTQNTKEKFAMFLCVYWYWIYVGMVADIKHTKG